LSFLLLYRLLEKQISDFLIVLKTVTMVYEVNLSGSYYAIGLEIGKMLENDKELLPQFSNENLVKGMAYEKEVRTHAP
jgi:hypothetical protein